MSKQVLPGLLKHEMENVNAMLGSPNEMKARQWNVGLVCSGLETYCECYNAGFFRIWEDCVVLHL